MTFNIVFTLFSVTKVIFVYCLPQCVFRIVISLRMTCSASKHVTLLDKHCCLDVVVY